MINNEMNNTREFSNISQPELFPPTKENNFFRVKKDLEMENSSEEIKEQIWSKAVLLYSLEKEDGTIDPVNYTNRLFNSILHNRKKVQVIEKTGLGNARYIEMPWRGDSIELQYDEEDSTLEGFVVNIFPREEEEEYIPTSEFPEISFTREDFIEGGENREIFECILVGLEN